MTSLPIPALLLCVAVGVIYSFIAPFVSETTNSALRKIPGPFAARFSRLWYLRAVSTAQFHHTNIELHRKHGPIVRLAPKQYSFNDPSVLKQIYGIGKGFSKSSWYEASSTPHAPFKDLFTDLDDARHATNRRLVANLYSASTLRNMEPEVEDCIKVFKHQLETLASSGTIMDLQFWMQCYAFDVISQITLGTRFGFLESGADKGGIFASLHEYLKYCALIGVEHEWHETLYWIMSKLPARGLAYVGQFTSEQIDKGKQVLEVADTADTAQRKDFLSKLFRLHYENPEKFPEAAIFTTCVTNIGAGSDTTSISLCAIMQNLATCPTVFQKLRQEIEAKYKELGEPKFIPFPETQSMEYLQACIKEALRLHPATGLPLERIVPQDGIVLSGTYFPAGTVVGVNTWVAHHNQDVFGIDADEFVPERWLCENKEKLSLMEANWMPFGAGSRTCIGKNISLLEINKLIPVLVRSFDFSIVDAFKQKHKNFWLVKQVNILCKVVSRA